MSVGPDLVNGPVGRARRAHAQADAQLSETITDFFLSDAVRLDERTRVMLSRVLTGVVTAIEADIRRHAARLLAGRGAAHLAEDILATGQDVAARLGEAGLLRDPGLMDELIGRVRQDLIAESLPTQIAGPDQPSVLVRLADAPDTMVAAAASALLVAEARRRVATAKGGMAGSDFPAELHHRLVWWVAAAVRPAHRADADTDRAIAEAALRSLGGHDEGERNEAAAMRLASAIDPRPTEIADLLIEAIGDRQLTLFIALVAQSGGLDYETARGLTLDPDGMLLWLALRAADLERTKIARIGLALSEADPRRDIESFADSLDAIMAVTPDEARAEIAPLTLTRDFRAAIRAVARSPLR